jgi:hypothetical protein
MLGAYCKNLGVLFRVLIPRIYPAVALKVALNRVIVTESEEHSLGI